MQVIPTEKNINSTFLYRRVILKQFSYIRASICSITRGIDNVTTKIASLQISANTNIIDLYV